MTALTDSSAWQNLQALAQTIQGQHMREWFEQDTNRAQRYTQSACGISLDFSKNLINDEVMNALNGLAAEQQVGEKRDAMFGGEIINFTEQRAVLHTALRNFSDEPVMVDGKDVMPESTGHSGQNSRFCCQHSQLVNTKATQAKPSNRW